MCPFCLAGTPTGLQPRASGDPSQQQQQQQHAAHAFLGYHETAWTINRFAHIARKNGLIDVCLASLTKIYTLPNIEIQDAFFKLREQAKWCAWDCRPPLDSCAR